MEINNKLITHNREPKTDFGRIAVLMGGPSSERKISLKSGKAVFEALRAAGVNVVAVDIKTDSVKDNILLLKRIRPDCVFIALHGRFGEDGSIQSILDSLSIPYTGSGERASSLAMDKIASRRIFEAAGLAVPKYKELNKNSRHSNFKFFRHLGFPLVVKPATHGSSIGLSIIDRKKDFKKAVELAFRFDEKIIVEKYIKGRELTVGILKERPLPVIEIIPKKKFFDFEAKYKTGMTDYIVPAKISAIAARKAQSAGLRAHKLLGCFGCSRVDMILSEDGIPYVLEVNTIPGLTNTSLLPKAARVLGIDFEELCLTLIRLAYEKEKS
ncbi:MAG: D-alanine--D-alanine ligase [Candidatus Omnitrophica bacterium]|nr:D-alanine--D-alanine ligase [Candidatus Omnitrophota bacterium]